MAIVAQVNAAVEVWKRDSLDRRRDLLLGRFDEALVEFARDPATFAERADAQALLSAEAFLSGRMVYAREAVALLDPEVVVVTQICGTAAELGQVIGQFIDSAAIELDEALQAAIGEAAGRLA